MLDTAVVLRRQSLAVAGFCAVADVGVLVVLCPGLWSAPVGWVAVALTVLVDLALAAPARLSGVVAVGHAVLQVVGPALLSGVGPYRGSNEAGLLVAGYRVGAWSGRWESTVAMAALAAGVVGGRLLQPGRYLLTDWRMIALDVLASALLPWLVGRNTTTRRGHLAELEQRESRRRAEERAAISRAVAEERTAIARDLHDVISHHVSAIGVHAGAARLALSDSTVPVNAGPVVPESTVRRSLSAVETASRSAMVDLRRLLDLLQRGDDGAVRQPGLDDLDDLVAGIRAAGLSTRVVTAGPIGDVPPSVDVALYRVVQEALTNALRHGGGSAEVVVRRRPGDVVLTVTNDTADGQAPTGGGRRGLAGIRQRAALFGGEVDCGPTPDGLRWTVRVTVPLENRES
ncbi:sensor histidine kinase [Actinokineospora iranica]|uniref:sensor histidine kinase n=1 Tax=Actinokineospora iranica TaxID=1271860 RepID=UPI000AA2A3EE|nr:histidine kinase [Actinokineospora iranica]